MTESFDRILARFGLEITVTGGAGTFSARAFLQPVNEPGKAAPFRVAPLGTADTRLWIYLGRAEVRPGDLVSLGPDRFLVENSAAVRVGGEVSHYWAALSRCREAAE